MRVHILHNALRGHPGSTLPGLDVQHVHGVDFLEGAALGLVDEEIHDEDADEAATGEDVAVGIVDGAGDEGCEEGDEEVPGPVGGGCDSDADGAVAGWVELTADSPHDRTPCSGVS